MSTSTPTEQYRQAARDRFESLKGNYTSVFWRLGNSFDTMIDFLDVVDHSAADDVADIVVKQYQASLDKLGGYDKAWFDDFGWWTIATQRAAEKSLFKPEFTNQFRGFMSECWKRFTGNAPYVWDRREPNTFNECRPAVDGGVWNEYWIGTSPTYPGPKNANPSSGSLEGIQNTVTNVVYLIAAQRLGLVGPDAKLTAEREYNFLSTWLWLREPPLWWEQDTRDDGALVRERVSHFFNGDPAPSFQMDWAWTGDQGLILGALIDRMALDRGNYQALLGRAKQLLTGVRTCLVEENGVLRHWSNSGWKPDGDTDDYETGTGVFWRNVLYAWKNNPDLRAFLSDPTYQRFLKVNADAAVDGTGADTNLEFNKRTNELAVLVAATVILQ